MREARSARKLRKLLAMASWISTKVSMSAARLARMVWSVVLRELQR